MKKIVLTSSVFLLTGLSFLGAAWAGDNVCANPRALIRLTQEALDAVNAGQSNAAPQALLAIRKACRALATEGARERGFQPPRPSNCELRTRKSYPDDPKYNYLQKETVLYRDGRVVAGPEDYTATAVLKALEAEVAAGRCHDMQTYNVCSFSQEMGSRAVHVFINEVTVETEYSALNAQKVVSRLVQAGICHQR